jgi:hypothetical protein
MKPIIAMLALALALGGCRESAAPETPQQRTERAAHECLLAMKACRRYCLDHPMIKVPRNLPYGDRMELQRKADERAKKTQEMHERRRAAEDRLAEAEKEYPAGYLRALRNAWDETIEREVLGHSPKTINDYDFDEAIALGRSVSRERK